MSFAGGAARLCDFMNILAQSDVATMLSLTPCRAACRESVQNPVRFFLNIEVGIIEDFSERAYCS